MHGEAVDVGEDEWLEEDADEEDTSGGFGGVSEVDEGDGRIGGGELRFD